MAGNKKSIEAGRGHVTLGVDHGPLVKGLQAAKEKVMSFGRNIAIIGASISAVGAVITAPFIHGVTVFADVGSALVDMRDRTGVAIEALSELTYAAEQSGASAEDLEGGLRFMSRAITAAADGSPAAIEALQAIGVTIDELQGMSQDARFERIADGIAAIQDPAERAARARAIFGRGAGRLLPLMSGGSGGIRSLRGEARDSGLSMSTADAEAAEALGDQMSRIGKQIKMLWFEIGASIAPIAKEFLTHLTNIISRVIFFMRENRVLVAIVFKVGAALLAIGTVITTIGGFIMGVGALIGGLATAISFLVVIAKPIAIVVGAIVIALVHLAAFLVPLVVAIGAMYVAMRMLGISFSDLWSRIQRVALPMLFGAIAIGLIPVVTTIFLVRGAVMALVQSFQDLSAFAQRAVAAISQLFANFGGSGGLLGQLDELIGYIEAFWGPAWQRFADTVGGAFSTIRTFIALGDFRNAFETMWVTVQLIFERYINALLDQWFFFKHTFLTTWDSVTGALFAPLRIVFLRIRDLMQATLQGIVGGVNAVITAINDLINALPEAMQNAMGLRPIAVLAPDIAGAMNRVDAVLNPAGQGPRELERADRRREMQLETDLFNLGRGARDAVRDHVMAATIASMSALASLGGTGPAPAALETALGGKSIGAFGGAGIGMMLGGAIPLEVMTRQQLEELRGIRRRLDGANPLLLD